MSDLLNLVDFHRDCFTICPDQNGEHRTFLIPFSNKKEQKMRLFCSCSKKGYAQCENAQNLSAIYQSHFNGDSVPSKRIEKSLFWNLLSPVTKIWTHSVYSIKTIQVDGQITVSDQQGRLLLHYRSENSDLERFLSRISPAPLSRFTLMNRAAEFMQSEQERALLAAGHKTQRQVVEESLWYRLAYHCFREFENTEIQVEPVVDNQTGNFSLHFRNDMLLISFEVPPGAVPSILQTLHKNGMGAEFQIDTSEKELYFRMEKKGDEISVNPIIKIDESRVAQVQSRFIYGTYLYLMELNRFVVLSYSSMKLVATGRGNVSRIKLDDFSSYLQKNQDVFSFEENVENTVALSLFSDVQASGFGRIYHPAMILAFDRIELNPVSIDENSCVLAVSYCSGETMVTLSEILENKKKRRRFLFTATGIVDLESEKIVSVLVKARGASDGTITLSKAALLQFRGSSLSTKIHGEEKLVSHIKQMLKFKPLKELEPLSGLQCTLREYQKLAVQWLLFLYDNHFGGLLCDDMGLGKTIQIIAFFLALKEQRLSKGAFLVICPTSVISHWNKLLQMFAPSLEVKTYHTSERENVLNENYDVLLTSYGIMRNDIDKLQKIMFEVVVFDEVHQLKNKETLSAQMALQLCSNVKIGVTGTPIENRLSDLKSLFDLILPGLFHKEYYQDEEFLASMEGELGAETEHLKKLISPFMMRRLKETVLTELPPKIEDIRTCNLNQEQQNIYRAAVEQRGGPIIEMLRNSEQPIPYMHVFTLLSFLKQVCNHPALAAGKPQEYEQYQSAKWDLFTELLDESLESGQKVVVFSQFVGMVEIIRLYLEKRKIGHVVLTGASHNREKIIKRFAEDNECRVFVGSLKAGGVGIDLVAGSVLIHYDRWWNPARENQATDRVHRIGQTRGVQVFKLVTDGTVEERIGSIIERKKELTEEILIEDSPDSIKNFSREELLELLSNA